MDPRILDEMRQCLVARGFRTDELEAKATRPSLCEGQVWIARVHHGSAAERVEVVILHGVYSPEEQRRRGVVTIGQLEAAQTVMFVGRTSEVQVRPSNLGMPAGGGWRTVSDTATTWDPAGSVLIWGPHAPWVSEELLQRLGSG